MLTTPRTITNQVHFSLLKLNKSVVVIVLRGGLNIK